jgi:hypothetical protein
MNSLDVLGYYVTKFSQLEIEVVQAIMNKVELTGTENYDANNKHEREKFKRKLSNSGILTETDLKTLMSKFSN